jgi:hypothetical protein
MRLLRMDVDQLYDEQNVHVADADLYVDRDTGQVYALDPWKRDQLDPLWREDVPENS